MRVLQINKYYYGRGGSERYLFEVSRLLAEAGHEVVPLAMRDRRNAPVAGADRFLTGIDYRADTPWIEKVRRAAKVIWNQEAYDRVSELAAVERPDIAHLHNIAHQLSGSVVAALDHAGVPAVQSLHDYKLVCPSYRIFRDGKRCEACRPYRYWNAVRYRCLLDSRAASAVAAAEAALYSAAGLYRKGIRRFHSPSRFLKETMERWGVDGEKIDHIPLTLNLSEYDPSSEDDGSFLFAGRLSHEKGLDTLLEAAALCPDIPIVAAGEGPERARSEAELERRGIGSLTFTGFLAPDDLRRRMARCRAVLIPSEWDENSPVVIYEAFALGKPVIGSTRGGIPEMVRPGETGLLVPPGDAAALAGAIGDLAEHRERAMEMGRAARRLMETEYAPEKHLERIVAFYRKAIG